MCDFQRLDKKRVSRDDRVVTIAAGFAVTDERFLDARKRREAVSAAEELLTLAVVLLAAPETFAARGGDALPRAALDAAARGVGAAVAGGDRYCASFAWRAVLVFEKALRSSVPSVRAAAASALARRDASGRNDFADACAALLFRRHDVGVPRPSFFNLRRWWDVALAEPEYRAANAARETGLTRGKKLDAAWRGAYLTPWRIVARAKARAFVEFDVGGIETGRSDGRGDERMHLFLRALDPTGASLGGTPLAEAGLDAADAEQASLKELRTKLRRDRARRARQKASERRSASDDFFSVDATDAFSDAFSSLSDESSDDFDLARGSDEALAQSHYAPDVSARRRAERHERRDAKAYGVTAAAVAAASLRRFAPPRRNFAEPPRRSWRRFLLSFGASAGLREARKKQDALRINLANRTLASLLDAALGGEGDQVRAANAPANADVADDERRRQNKSSPLVFLRTIADAASGRGVTATAVDGGAIAGGHGHARSGPDAIPEPLPALTYRAMAFLFLGLVVETPPPPRPGAVPPAGAAAAAAAAAALALRGGGVPAFLKTDYFDGGDPAATPPSRTYLAAALRACGGVDRPPLVASRASEFVTALAARRRTRGALLRALAAVMADAAAPTLNPKRVALDEDARVTLCVRALGMARRAAELARRDRVVAAQLSILAAHAHLRGDRAALVGDKDAESNTNTRSRRRMFLKLRASAACDAARRVDRDSLVAASRGATRLLGDASPDVRVAAAGAIAALATVLVAAEASFAAAAVAARVGECHADRGDGDVPAGRWSVPRDDWQQGLGEGDDDMVPEGDAVAEAAEEGAAEEEAAEEERAEKKKKEAPKRSRHADFSAPVKEEESTRTRLEEDEALDPEKALPSGDRRTPNAAKTKKTSAATDPLEGAFVPAATSRLFDSARLLVSLDRAAAQDTHPGARDALLAAREAVASARARAVAAARRVATGGVLGAHVSTWASLCADASLPGVVDATVTLKFEALVRPMRRRIAEARRLSRQQVDANAAGDVDVEAARALEWEARRATEEEVAAYGLLDEGDDVDDVEDKKTKTRTAATDAAGVFTSAPASIAAYGSRETSNVQGVAEIVSSRGAPRDAEIESASESASSRAAREAEAFAKKKKPKSPTKTRVTSPVRVAETLDEAHVAYLARVKRLARRAAESHDDAPLTAGELVRTTGPTKQTVAAVMTMLGRSVAKQHEKHEHAARARVAHRWREAREKDARREAEKNIPLHLLRRGGNPPLTNATNVASSSREARVSRAPVDLAALRAARRDAPPGGDMQLSRPTGSRPALERARAADAFRRVAETDTHRDAVAARRAKQAAEDAVKAARKAEISRRYYGTDTFKKPVVKKNLDADGPRVVKDSSGRTWMM